MIYSNFFSPPLVSMLFCLHESTIEIEEKDPRSHVVQFLIRKILSITDARTLSTTHKEFEAEIAGETGNFELVEKYKESVGKIQSFNDFYRQVSKMLKTLRSLRNNKLQQGNLIDFLVRRLYIYFEKLDFQEIIRIYQRFQDYVNGSQLNLHQHQFMLTKSIEELKFNLENYGASAKPEDLGLRILNIKQYDHTNKSSYLLGVVGAEARRPLEAVQAIHRYFDKSLGNLFQEKSEVSLMSNKINHCILSSAFLNLKMHGLQECLQSISEGLRISQNNSDEESINNCIIYLYRIAQHLGKYQQEILLNEHAITHSLNLNNTQLMVYSCFNYSLLEKKHPCTDPNILLLKDRSIAWTDALHFSRKKLFTTFESNCKNIYHSHRSLLIPTFLAKLAVLVHLPQLTPLLLNPYYRRPELFELQIYKQFQGCSPLDSLIRKIGTYSRTGQPKLLQIYIQRLQDMQEKVVSPLEIIMIKHTLNRARFNCPWLTLSHSDIDHQIELCRRWGFVREELLEARLLSIRTLMRNGMLQDALVMLEGALQQCEEQKLTEYRIGCELLRTQIRLRLGTHWGQVAGSLQSIEQDSHIIGIRKEFKILFLETQVLLNRTVYTALNQNADLLEECELLKKNEVAGLEQILRGHLEDNNFLQAQQVLRNIHQAQLMHHALFDQNRSQRTKSSLQYCEKVVSTYKTLENEAYDQQELIRRISTKLIHSYFL